MKKLLLTISLFTALQCQAITKKEVYRMLIKHEIKHPEIVLKQCLLETGHLTSKAYKKRNNLFGFIGGQKYFNSIESCIRYYKRWQSKRYTKGNYYSFLLKVPVYEGSKIVTYRPYATDKYYITKLKKIVL